MQSRRQNPQEILRGTYPRFDERRKRTLKEEGEGSDDRRGRGRRGARDGFRRDGSFGSKGNAFPF
eukprot:scaffold24_cov341-Pavlova_lutheri.AAC.35